MAFHWRVDDGPLKVVLGLLGSGKTVQIQSFRAFTVTTIILWTLAHMFSFGMVHVYSRSGASVWLICLCLGIRWVELHDSVIHLGFSNVYFSYSELSLATDCYHKHGHVSN